MRSVPETLAVGIVGAGTIGRVHVRAIAGLDGVRVAAVAEPQETVGRELASEAGAEWRSSLEDLLNDSVDIVVLATPSGLHPDQAVAAAKAGKHVVTEKPMAITAEGASAMIDAAEAHGVTLAVIFQNRFSPDTIKLKHAVDAGMLGRLIIGNAFVHWHRSDDYYAASGGWRGTWALDGGGALMNHPWSVHHDEQHDGHRHRHADKTCGHGGRRRAGRLVHGGQEPHRLRRPGGVDRHRQ